MNFVLSKHFKFVFKVIEMHMMMRLNKTEISVIKSIPRYIIEPPPRANRSMCTLEVVVLFCFLSRQKVF